MNRHPAPLSTACAAAIWSGVGEVKIARASRIEHAAPDEAEVQRLVAAAAAGNERDLPGLEMQPPHEAIIRVERDEVVMTVRETGQAFVQHGIDAIHKFFHQRFFPVKISETQVFSGRLDSRKSPRRRGPR
jgi:hypothetical protein